MADNDNPTGPSGDAPKRRRIAADDDEDNDSDNESSTAQQQQQMDVEEAAGGAANDAQDEGEGDGAPPQQQQEEELNEDEEQRRRQRLEQRVAERRRRRLQKEAAELRETAFPGDEFYVGEEMQEVPDANILQDPAMDEDDDARINNPNNDNPDDDVSFVEHNNSEDDYDTDGDYIGGGADDDDAAGQLLAGGNRKRRKGKKGDDNDDEEEEEGEDLLDNLQSDYQHIAALDTYGYEDIDDRAYNALNPEQRAAADRILDVRDKEREKANRALKAMGGRSRGFYGALEDEIEEEEEEERNERRKQFAGRGLDSGTAKSQRREEEEEYDSEGNVIEKQGGDDMDMEDEEHGYLEHKNINIEAFADVYLPEWIAQSVIRNEVVIRMRKFLHTFVGVPELDISEEMMGTLSKSEQNHIIRERSKHRTIYEDKIRHMCSSNKAALEVSHIDFIQMEPQLAMWVTEEPRGMFEILNDAATRHTFMMFPSYGNIRDEIHVRFCDVPISDSLRDLRRSHLNALVKVSGVITRRSGVMPMLKLAYYDCIKCKCTTGPIKIEEDSSMTTGPVGPGDSDVVERNAPPLCPDCDSEGPFKLNSTRSKYRNWQKVNLQERPGSVPPGRVPRTKEVHFLDDLVDLARPGEEVDVTGIFCSKYDYFLTNRSGFPVFSTHVSANHIRKKEDASAASNLSEADRKQILDLASDPNIGKRIVQSIAPSIYGHEHVKMSLAMSLFGAVPKNVDDKHRIRGDVNVLLLGDPGTAKSQMLKYAEATAPRAVYSTGKGASAVGLTASVQKDPVTKEWTLEGGALVLADRGVCLIDEFDKMNEQDRTSIHEAMEQQSISVSKAGIVTSLQARCSVIAAANPIGGRYDSSCTLSENVELTDPILQRFDCLCVLQDTVDPVADERLARFVTESHMMSVPTSDVARGVALGAERTRLEPVDGVDVGDLIPQALLRKYIQYARANCRPALRGGTFDQEKIASLYVQLRKESSSSGGVPIAVRHIESMMRMAEAHAKMHLRDYVRDDDMDASIKMMLESFISAQKFSVRRSLRRSFAKFMSSGEDRVHLLLHILQEMMRNEAMYQTIRKQQMNEKDVPEVLEVLLEEFESRARDRRIYDVGEFCKSQDFAEAGYTLDARRRVIVRNF